MGTSGSSTVVSGFPVWWRQLTASFFLPSHTDHTLIINPSNASPTLRFHLLIISASSPAFCHNSPTTVSIILIYPKSSVLLMLSHSKPAHATVSVAFKFSHNGMHNTGSRAKHCTPTFMPYQHGWKSYVWYHQLKYHSMALCHCSGVAITITRCLTSIYASRLVLSRKKKIFIR